MPKASLHEYRSRRDFRRTTEPEGRGTSRHAGHPRWVIQHHQASSDHYDFRLEVDGVLKSWAVPKGPSTDPRVRRLAVPTEDHPIDYLDFEGIIPEGAYGAGTVLVWDTGTYENITGGDDDSPAPMADALADGHVAVRLHGEKLRGGFALTRTGGAGAARWLLVKIDDADADARRNPVSTEPRSVKTGRTMAAVRRESTRTDDVG